MAGVALGGLGLSLFVAPGAANAALPLSPDANLVVFPFRDMVVMEGWENRAGQNVKLEVFRGTQLMGAAQGTITAGAEFEVNHPGGACWGNGSGFPQVTPDIRAGDKVVATFVDSGTPVTYETTVQDAHVAPNTAPVFLPGSNTTFTIGGHIADNVPDSRIEQRIINPDLADTDVGRRDIRATFGPMTPAPNGGYDSMLEIDRSTDTFVATYEFTGPNAAANAALAASSGGERALSWESAAGEERIGLTIAEDDEPGGPGMGGCPPGPDGAAATPGSYTVTTTASGTTVSWTAAAAQPGAAAVSGYSVSAVAKTPTATGERSVTGVRTGVDARNAKLTFPAGTTATDYDFEVRALLDNGQMGAAFPRANDATTPPPPPPGSVDTTPPPAVTVAQDPATGAVTLSNTEATADIFYTLGNDPVLSNDDLGANATVYTTPIAVTAPTTINFVAFDRAGNHTAPVTLTFQPAAPAARTAPGMPAGVTVTPAASRLVVNWVAPANTGGVPLTRYQVRVQSPAIVGTGTTQAPQVPAYDNNVNVTPDAAGVLPTTRTINGLTNGRPYTVEVRAQNGTGAANSSAYTAPITARPGDSVTATLVRNRAGDKRIGGTGSESGTTFRVYQTSNPANVGNATAAGTISLGTATVTPAVAPATGVEWELRLRTNGTFPAGATIWVQSSGGGVASFRV